VESADQTATKAKQAGGTVIAEPFDVMEHGRMAVIQDPTGAVFAIWQPNKHVGATLVNETGAMCWNELLTKDTAKAGTFYKQVFGWTEKPMQGLQGPYTVFENHGAQAAGMMQITPQMGPMPSNWSIYFAVDDTDKATAKAQQLGAKVMMPPTDIPNVGRFAVLQDPQGAMFCIIKITMPSQA
jgi:predicted enzyme related to lactoylglutathione lyase